MQSSTKIIIKFDIIIYKRYLQVKKLMLYSVENGSNLFLRSEKLFV